MNQESNNAAQNSSAVSIEKAGEAPDSVLGLAGPEVDAAIDQRVMQRGPSLSWEILRNDDEHASAIGFEREAAAIKWLDERPSMKASYHVGAWKHYPQYSANIAAAMEVVEKMIQNGWRVRILGDDAPVAWDAVFWREDCSFGQTGHVLAEAICRAALHACASAAAPS